MSQILLYGIESIYFKSLKIKIESLLVEQKSNLKLVEIKEYKAISKMKVSSIPAIIFNQVEYNFNSKSEKKALETLKIAIARHSVKTESAIQSTQ